MEGHPTITNAPDRDDEANETERGEGAKPDRMMGADQSMTIPRDPKRDPPGLDTAFSEVSMSVKARRTSLSKVAI